MTKTAVDSASDGIFAAMASIERVAVNSAAAGEVYVDDLNKAINHLADVARDAGYHTGHKEGGAEGHLAGHKEGVIDGRTEMAAELTLTHDTDLEATLEQGRIEGLDMARLGYVPGSDGERYILARAAGIRLDSCVDAQWLGPTPGELAMLYGTTRGCSFTVSVETAEVAS